MKQNPLISVVVPTRNSSQAISECLISIVSQSYKNIELIVIDNNSTDRTKDIARQYTEKVFNKGPERSAQRNYGVKQARGEYIAIIDSDMQLSKNVLSECVHAMIKDTKSTGVIIPEISFGVGYWSKCKALERSFYVGVDGIEAARFFKKETYSQLGGYDERMVSGEDWDLSQKAANLGSIARIQSYIRHNEGQAQYGTFLRKKYYYGKNIRSYMTTIPTRPKYAAKQFNVVQRYWLFFKHPFRLLSHPITAFGMLFLKTSEFAAGGLGFLLSKRARRLTSSEINHKRL